MREMLASPFVDASTPICGPYLPYQKILVILQHRLEDIFQRQKALILR